MSLDTSWALPIITSKGRLAAISIDANSLYYTSIRTKNLRIFKSKFIKFGLEIELRFKHYLINNIS